MELLRSMWKTAAMEIREIEYPPVTMYAAIEDGEPIGALSVFQDDYISLVYVTPAHRRRGIATKLLEYARSKRPVYHSESRTQAGGGWSRAMGDDGNFERSDSQMAEGDGELMLRTIRKMI
jgi:GNAT superfamily N-acetyltransferase